MIDAIEKQAQRAVANDRNTEVWSLVLLLCGRARKAEARLEMLNQDYDVLVKDYQKLEERQTCECGMAPEIKLPEREAYVAGRSETQQFFPSGMRGPK